MAVDIYQIDYKPDLTAPPEFKRFDCSRLPAWEKREVFHMHRFYKEGRYLNSEYSGIVSPKFSSKTKVTAKRFIDFINKNPGNDVYFINPFPHLSYTTFNVWEQGEVWHPDLCRLADALFAAGDLDWDISGLPRNTSDTLLYSNYWAGNSFFWERFMAVVGKLMAAVSKLSANDQNKLSSIAAHSSAATYYPFIFERIFSTFLLREPGIKFLAYPWSHSEIIERCETETEKLVVSEWRDMIDRWDAEGIYTEDQRKIFSTLSRLRRSSGNSAKARSRASELCAAVGRQLHNSIRG
jgi:hypothetical protein